VLPLLLLVVLLPLLAFEMVEGTLALALQNILKQHSRKPTESTSASDAFASGLRVTGSR